jgi:hypothetical protein
MVSDIKEGTQTEGVGTEVTGGWKKLLNEEQCDLYSLASILIKLRKVRWVGHVARIGAKGIVYKLLVGKPE